MRRPWKPSEASMPTGNPSWRPDRPRARPRNRQLFAFLTRRPPSTEPAFKVQGASAGISQDLRRQLMQGTGPAAKPNAQVEKNIRSVAYALSSGADGWMFDSEDALCQVSAISLDNQRNFKLAFHRDPRDS